MREETCPKCDREYATFPRLGVEGLFACPYCGHDALAELRLAIEQARQQVNAPDKKNPEQEHS